MVKRLQIFFSNKQYRSVGIIFSVNSLLFGSWITWLPEIQNRLQISEGQLGLALLGLPLGSITIMPFMGWIIQKIGAGRVTLYSGITFCIMAILPVLSNSYLHLFSALFLVGLTGGSMDIAMNAAAAAMEKRNKYAIMSTCHGMWSIGGMLGAGTTSLLAALGLTAGIHLGLLAILLTLLMFSLSDTILKVKDAGAPERVFILPSRSLMALAIIGFCAMMGEGAIADWSAVYLKNTLSADLIYSGLGFAGFSMTMALGRFYGDRLIEAYGARKLIFFGGLVAFTGLLIGLMMPNPYVAITGFTFSGAGFSCLVPAIYISAARMPDQNPGASLAAVAGLGYFGLFIGPPSIGFIAEHFGLNLGLGIVVFLMAVIVLVSWKSRF